MKLIPKYGLALLLGLLLSFSCWSQEVVLEHIDSLLAAKELETASSAFDQIDTTRFSEYQRAWHESLLGRYHTLKNQDHLAFHNFMKARQHFLGLDSFAKVADINLQIVELILATNNKELDYGPYLSEYIQYSLDQNTPDYNVKAYMELARAFINAEPEKSLFYFRKAQTENLRTTDSLTRAKIHHSLGVVFAEFTSNLDSALYHYDIALEQYQKLNLIDNISYIYINRASVNKKQGNYRGAIENYLKADSLPIQEYYKNNKKLLYGYLSDALEKNKDYENAIKYLKLHNAFKDSLSEEQQNTAIYDIQTKYEVEKKENENLELKQRTSWLFAGLALAILLLLLSYLAYKNQLSKRKIAQAKNELEKQKVEKLLKEQELSGIDAMIQGQEKERKRIANDLHDNLGSILATIKLHVQNLKIRKERIEQQERIMLEKTDSLIEEAYQKVRNLAHARNAGVKSREGLLPAIKSFATKASVANKLVIEVEDHGMEERLENTLEITLFRIVQELITNVIKHAHATECTIHLTHHNDNINIMVEDNGSGFDQSMINKDQGMGLYSIQQRVENLEGQVTIESIIHRGTNVIIDIPLQ